MGNKFVQFEKPTEKVEENKPSIDFKQYLNVFEFDTILPGSGEKVTFKPMTTGQLKKLLVYENETDISVMENIVDNLISECVISENFNINDLYLQDRFFLLVKLREKTRGSNYDIHYKCPKCNSQILNVIDISKLNIKKIDNNKINDNIIKVNNKLSLRLNILKRGDQKSIAKKISSNLSETSVIAETSILSHAASIKSIITPEGESENISIEDKIYIIENLTTEIYDKIREWHDNIDFGIDFTTEVECKNTDCKNKEKIMIPTETFFF